MSVDVMMPDLNYVLAEDPPDERTVHAYPKAAHYRLSGNRATPQPGDIARCGHVKNDNRGVVPAAQLNCPQCLRLSAIPHA